MAFKALRASRISCGHEGRKCGNEFVCSELHPPRSAANPCFFEQDPDWGRNVGGPPKEAGYLPKVRYPSHASV